MKRRLFIGILLIGLFAASGIAQTRIIAHRGFWDTPGSAQNSIAALRKADSIHCYGSEFDVWMASDGELMVNHDPFFKLKNIQRTSSKKLSKLSLKNGEAMPTLRQYLEEGKNTRIRLVLELKKHKTPRKETKAIEKIIRMVNELNLEDRVEYISFSLHAVKEFVRLSPPKTPVYYLEGNLAPAQLKEIGCTGPDYNLSVYRKHPQWIEQSHKLGLKVNCWTVNNEKDMRWLMEQNVEFITTDKPLLMQQILDEEITN
ncbi:glycerophosphodiester phosphodiesterase [Bacteroides sp. OttesenSCG-928-D19]|nr:glycerophosphodiester phosphodiesterase [Bacteroides sp. OttesenSCG-928-N06]MDL2305126.1 glycerophosphodiester phosphodiesterase [Bacteroides sp. OttesenSCG-928-D19]